MAEPETAVAVIGQKVSTVSSEARKLVITSQQTLDLAGEFLTTFLLPLKKDIIATFEPIKRKARATWQEALDQEKRHLQPLEDAEAAVKGKIKTFLDDQKRIERERQFLADQEAHRKAEEDRKAQLALERELGTSEEEIQQIEQAPLKVEEAAPVETIQAPKGVTTRKVWKVAVDDKQAFIKYVAAHPDLAYLLDVNLSFLTSLTVNEKGKINFPGIRSYQDEHVAGRGR